MRNTIIPLVGCLLVSLVVAECLASSGGDSGHGTSDQCPFGIIEGPDPIGLIDCFADPKEKGASRDKNASNGDPILPPGQMQSGQARPDFGSNAKTGQPFMVWADRNTREHDIAYAGWTGSGWDRVEYVASSRSDELDPRAFAADDGSIQVVWWTDDVTPVVYVARRDPGFEGWTAAIRVAGSARRPTVAIVDGRVWVAFEREGKLGLRYAMVAAELPDGTFAERIVATSEHGKDLGVEIHVDAGRLWLDWKHSREEFGFAEWFDGHWSETTTVPWTDRSWAGEQEIRRDIRDLLLSR
jgi:hypothetical protein